MLKSRRIMKPLLYPFLLISLSLTPLRAESPVEPMNLISLEAWTEVGDWAIAGTVEGSSQEKKWKSIQPGTGILYNGAEGKSINLTSKGDHGDCELEVEFMIPKGSNSGIYLMGRYELQILDSYGKSDGELSCHDGGGVYERWDSSKPKGQEGYEGTAPSTNASSAPGTWQTYLIHFRAPRFDADGKKTENARFVRVEHNGVVIHENVEVTGPTRGASETPETARGQMIVQGDHSPIAYRKLLVRHNVFK
jgi:hypothetical protein